MPEPCHEPDVLRLTGLLSDIAFPARKWELTTHAEDRGADGNSRRELARLPEGLYRDADAVISMVVAANRSDLRQAVANGVTGNGIPTPRTGSDQYRRSTDHLA